MSQAEIARAIYHWLRKHRFLTEFDKINFDDLPHDTHNQLVEIAGQIPLPDPNEGIRKMRSWCKRSGNYQTTETIDRFLAMEAGE
jgi:hypothetical protein